MIAALFMIKARLMRIIRMRRALIKVFPDGGDRPEAVRGVGRARRHGLSPARHGLSPAEWWSLDRRGVSG
ncbi:MAG: hypothetical protein FWD74_10870 [Actinomycetia bacterium]|nr:hypothetical protein [Actinomycetes bacterium]